MGFDKKTYETEFQVLVTHQWHPGQGFIFTFPKLLPQAALDAEKAFLALPDKERSDAQRVLLIKVVAQMVTRDVEGFPNFPAGDASSLPKRMLDYFDDPTQPELEAIIASAWSGYKAAARPAAYTKSLSRNSQGNSSASGATAQAESGV